MGGLADLNQLPAASAEAQLLRCCGSRRWARAMTGRRPFATVDAMMTAADTCWMSLQPDDWLEAFSAHPRIGDSSRAPGHPTWAAQEQAGLQSASEMVRARLAEANRRYEARFGYIFIVCATGKSADEMLAIVEERLSHDPETELQVAGEEQRNITRLRLERLLSAEGAEQS